MQGKQIERGGAPHEGQLIQQHGYEEATKKIESGRYRKEEDSDGDSIYMRVNKKHSKEASRETTQTLERSDTNKNKKTQYCVYITLT